MRALQQGHLDDDSSSDVVMHVVLYGRSSHSCERGWVWDAAQRGIYGYGYRRPCVTHQITLTQQNIFIGRLASSPTSKLSQHIGHAPMSAMLKKVYPRRSMREVPLEVIVTAFSIAK